MQILSKSVPLEVTIQKIEGILKNLGLNVSYSMEKHPLEHCFSINLSLDACPNSVYSNGKGKFSLSSKASALGEFIERLQTNHFFSDFYIPTTEIYPDQKLCSTIEECLNEHLRSFYNPNGDMSFEDWIDFNSSVDDAIIALPFKDMMTQETIDFPQNVLANLYASNGLATGNTIVEAQVQGLSEICERYVKIKVIKEALTLPKIPESVIKEYETIYNDIQILRDKGYFIDVFDASLGGKFPVCAISLINPKKHTLFVSFGAHPIFEVAFERTLTELMQGRDLDCLDDFERPTFDRDVIEDSLNIESHFIDSNGKIGIELLKASPDFEYCIWPYNGTTIDDEHLYLLEIFTSLNKKVYARNYNYLGIDSTQIIVPGVSEIYPIEDMVYNNKNSGKFVREVILNLYTLDPNDVYEAVEFLEDSLNVEKLIGVLFEENFTIGKLKAQLLILMESYDEALAVLMYEESDEAIILKELLMMIQCGHEFDQYADALSKIYGENLIQKMLQVIRGERFWINTSVKDEYKNICHLAQKLDQEKSLLQ